MGNVEWTSQRKVERLLLHSLITLSGAWLPSHLWLDILTHTGHEDTAELYFSVGYLGH